MKLDRKTANKLILAGVAMIIMSVIADFVLKPANFVGLLLLIVGLLTIGFARFAKIVMLFKKR